MTASLSLFLAAVLFPPALKAQTTTQPHQAVLVKNIGTQPILSSIEPRLLTAAGTRAFFVTDRSPCGEELWVSDGTPAGTRLVKDIAPGAASSNITRIVASGTEKAPRVFFIADDGTHGPELWISDGTEAGTRLIADLAAAQPGQGSAITSLHAFKGGAIFVATADLLPAAVWWTDGTPAGTRMIKKVRENPGEPPHTPETGWGSMDGFFYFSYADDAEPMNGLWKTDGTAAGTSRVASFVGGAGVEPTVLGVIGKTLFFTAPTVANGWELWKTDGTRAGTKLVRDVLPGNDSSYPRQFVSIGTQGYFLADGDQNVNLWTTDGTTHGTRPMTAPHENLDFSHFEQLAVTGKTLLAVFNRTVPSPIPPGYITDGGMYALNTQKNTWETLLITSQEILGLIGSPSQAYFATSSLLGTRAVFMTDGTWAGTHYASDIAPLTGFDADIGMVLAGQRLFHGGFAGAPSLTSPTLWTFDGTPGHPQQEIRIQQSDSGSTPVGLQAIGGKIYFAATTPEHGQELWVSDGTGTGTRLVKDIFPGPEGASPALFTEMNGAVYFTARHPDYYNTISRTDGTVEGTSMVAGVPLGNINGAPIESLTAFGNKLYFPAFTNLAGTELWASDGTEDGTRMASNINLAPLNPYNPLRPHSDQDSSPHDFVQTATNLYFKARGWYEVGLYKIDGQYHHDTGIAPLGTAVPDPLVVIATLLKPGQSVVYLWTKGQDKLIRYDEFDKIFNEVLSFGEFPELKNLQQAADEVIFEGHAEGTSAVALWLSKGSQATTRILTQAPHLHLLRVVGNRAYYTHSSDQDGGEDLACVALDGTVTTELLAHDTEETRLRVEHVEGSRLYFTRTVVADGERTLWVTGGSLDSTHQIQGVSIPKLTDSRTDQGFNMTSLNGQIYFSAYSPTVGHELFTLKEPEGRLEVDLVTGEFENRYLPLASGSKVNLSPTTETTPVITTLRLRNTGNARIDNVIATLNPEDLPFTFSPSSVALWPGEERNLQVIFHPQTAGNVLAALHLTATTGGPPEKPLTQPFSLTLAGTCYPYGNVPPRITSKIDPRLVTEGSLVTLAPMSISSHASTTSTWKRGSTTVGHEAFFRIESARPTDAGLYSLTLQSPLGKTTSDPIPVAIIAAPPVTLEAAEASPLRLTCPVTVPAGCQITYQWFKGEQDYPGQGRLIDMDQIRGSQTAHLQVNPIRREDSGAVFFCEVTLSHQGRKVVEHYILPPVSVFTGPYIELPPSLYSYPGRSVYRELYVSEATSITAKGLPPGLKLDAVNWVVTGRTAQAREAPYLVTFTARNDADSRSFTIPWYVRPLCPAGGYDALVEPMDSGEKRGLGGRLQFTSTVSGTVSGQLRHEGKTYRFSSLPELVDDQEYNGNVTAEITISRGKNLEPYVLRLTFGDEQRLTVSVGESWSSSTSLLSHRFSAKEPAGIYAGPYTWTFSLPGANELSEPAGSGFCTAALSPTGTLTWRGKLSDGTAITGSSPVLQSPGNLTEMAFFLHQELYQGTGVLTATTRLMEPDAQNPVIHALGDCHWWKTELPEGLTSRNYGDGFDLAGYVIGEKYHPPEAGQRLLGFSETGTDPNGLFEMLGEEIYYSQEFTLTARNIVAPLPKVSGEEFFLKSLTFAPKTGTFKAGILITCPRYGFPTKPWVLNATVEGILLPQAKTGHGFVLLPDVDSGATSLPAMPLMSLDAKVSGG